MQVWNTDLPHSRAQCGSKPFSTTPSTSNAARCPKCYCYVCDTEATECTAWGTGAQPPGRFVTTCRLLAPPAYSSHDAALPVLYHMQTWAI